MITCLSFLYSTRGLFGRVESNPAFLPAGHFIEIGIGYKVFGGNEVTILIVFGEVATIGTGNEVEVFFGLEGGDIEFVVGEEFGHDGFSLGGKVLHVSYYEESMRTSGKGNGGDLIVKDEFIRLLIQFICFVLGGAGCGTIGASDKDLNIGFSTDVGGDGGNIKGLELAKVKSVRAGLELVVEFLLEVDEVSFVEGGDTDAKFWAVAGELLDEFDGEKTLSFVASGVSGELDGFAFAVD